VQASVPREGRTLPALLQQLAALFRPASRASPKAPPQTTTLPEADAAQQDAAAEAMPQAVPPAAAVAAA
jgi:hypothetical protein